VTEKGGWRNSLIQGGGEVNASRPRRSGGNLKSVSVMRGSGTQWVVSVGLWAVLGRCSGSRRELGRTGMNSRRCANGDWKVGSDLDCEARADSVL
jgi:hypothetical protein